MKPRLRTNIIVALLVVAFCIFIALVMLFRIGKFSFAKSDQVRIVFNFVNGLDAGAPVRFGGALVGKVDRVEVLNSSEREKLGKGKNILVVADLNKPVDLTQGTEVTINTMGFIGEKYIEIRPGPPGSAPLSGNLLVGNDPAQMEKLISSGQKLIDDLQVTAENLNRITKELDARLPGLTDKMDHALNSAERAMDTIGSKEAQDQIRNCLANLKVITTYGKIFTTTVAEKPWRLIWGGKVRPLPPESAILGKPATGGQTDPAPVSVPLELQIKPQPAPERTPVTQVTPAVAAHAEKPAAIQRPSLARSKKKANAAADEPEQAGRTTLPKRGVPYSVKGRR